MNRAAMTIRRGYYSLLARLRLFEAPGSDNFVEEFAARDLGDIWGQRSSNRVYGKKMSPHRSNKKGRNK